MAKTNAVKLNAMEHSGNDPLTDTTMTIPLVSLIEGESPDEFTTMCRNSLRQLVAKLPPKEAKLVFEHCTLPNGFTTKEQHEAWLRSFQYKAMSLEMKLKQDDTYL